MADSRCESSSGSSSDEELPSLAFLMGVPELSRPRPPSADRGGALMSSGSEGEGAKDGAMLEVAALRGRVAARAGPGCEPRRQPDGGLRSGGDSAGQGLSGDPEPAGGGWCGGAEGPALPVGSGEPSSPLVSAASEETSLPAEKRRASQREREEVCQAAGEQREEGEAKRRLQEEEKERKRALAQELKAQRPGECQKYIRVVLDPALFQVEGGEQIRRALEAADYSCVVENQAVACSITWRRAAVSSQVGGGDEWTEEPNVLVLLGLGEFLSMAQSYKQKADGCTEGQKMTLLSYVVHVMEKQPGKILALAVVGVENYFRSLRVQSKQGLRQAAAHGNQKEEREGRKEEVKDSDLDFTRMDMEEALVDLQLCTQVQVSFFETCEELGEHVTMFTKAVAEAPFKREWEDTGFSFCLEKRWCGGVKVDHSGKGLLEVWKRQMLQFDRVGPAVADAIVSAYPSPQLLIEAYGRCSSDQERENLLANIPVHRGEGVTATSRRIGPELSRRIYRQMTSYNPELCLYFTG